MKRIVQYMLLLALAAGLSAMAAHKFYVAVFQMDHVPEKKVLQVTSRVFMDDLEAALNKKYNLKFYLGTNREIKDADEYIKKYFLEKMQVKVNGAAKPITFIGREVEDDIFICYYKIPAEGKIKTLEVKNTTLFEQFRDQQNIIHTNINRNKKSILLTNDDQQGTLEF